MSKRNPLQYIIITLKGMAMGAADVVPGVSGGTIAFIAGIYEELIETIHKLDLKFFRCWKKEGFISTWRYYNLNFLFALLLGIIISILSLAKLITQLLKDHPVFVWSFFFGLVIASIIFVAKQISTWKLLTWISIILASIASYFITLAEPLGTPEDTWFLFFAGFIAIIAMILPGISGAFILLIIGAYQSIMEVISLLSEGITNLNWGQFSQALLKISIFLIGAAFGIKIFSRVLNWMFHHHKNTILAILTGFMIGALNKIWPWKEVLEFRTNHHGEQVPFIERSVLPGQYADDPQLLMAVTFMVIGFLTIILLERISLTKKG
jgi:putative membrane protein